MKAFDSAEQFGLEPFGLEPFGLELMAERLADKARRGPTVTPKRCHDPIPGYLKSFFSFVRTHYPEEPGRLSASIAGMEQK